MPIILIVLALGRAAVGLRVIAVAAGALTHGMAVPEARGMAVAALILG